MSAPLPEFYTVRTAAARAMRGYATILDWINSGFLKIVEGGYFPGNRKRHIILGTDLDIAIAKAERLLAMEPGERRRLDGNMAARRRQNKRAWLKRQTPEKLAAIYKRNQEHLRTWKMIQKRRSEAALLLGPAPGGRSSRAAGTKNRSSKRGKSKPLRTQPGSKSGGTLGLTPSRPQSRASSGASPSTWT